MEKYPPTVYLSGYPNVVILHSVFLASQTVFLASQKIDNENSFLECTQDIEKLLESENI
jgi:hypothetical protein